MGGSFFAYVMQPADEPSYCQKYEKGDYANDNSKQADGWWRRAICDPVSAFTLLVAVFTAVLSGSTIMLWLAGERQIGILKKSVAAAERSADVAKEAADASLEANKLNREMFIAENRPWIDVRNIRIDGPLMFDDWGAQVDIAFDVENVGKLPAINMAVAANLAIAGPKLLGPESKAATACAGAHVPSFPKSNRFRSLCWASPNDQKNCSCCGNRSCCRTKTPPGQCRFLHRGRDHLQVFSEGRTI